MFVCYHKSNNHQEVQYGTKRPHPCRARGRARPARSRSGCPRSTAGTRAGRACRSAGHFEQGKKSLLDNGDKNFVNPKEKLYDHFPLTVHQMDIIIGVLFALIALFLILGVTHTSFFGLFGG